MKRELIYRRQTITRNDDCVSFIIIPQQCADCHLLANWHLLNIYLTIAQWNHTTNKYAAEKIIAVALPLCRFRNSIRVRMFIKTKHPNRHRNEYRFKLPSHPIHMREETQRYRKKKHLFSRRISNPFDSNINSIFTLHHLYTVHAQTHQHTNTNSEVTLINSYEAFWKIYIYCYDK